MPSILTVVDNAVAVHSAVHVHHAAAVRMESWEIPPTTGGPDGADRDERQVVFDDDADEIVVYAQAPMATAPETGMLHLNAPGEYRVRAYRWGSNDAIAAYAADPDRQPDGIERFLIQFWRIGDITDHTTRHPGRGAPAEHQWDIAIRDWAQRQGFGPNPPAIG
ncbi:hypothetical protein [Kibdelosporangium persicum]|nr:hypothetical protein [Kibdelosporangium persicum]